MLNELVELARQLLVHGTGARARQARRPILLAPEGCRMFWLGVLCGSMAGCTISAVIMAVMCAGKIADITNENANERMEG